MTRDPDKIIEKVNRIEKNKENIRLGGGKEKVEKQHNSGKLTARERIDLFFDPGTFIELDIFGKVLGKEFGIDKLDLPADGVITGYGKVDGRLVAALSQDYTVIAGTMGEMHGRKILKITKLAGQMKIPLIGFNESGGARLQEFLEISRTYGEWFYYTSIFSGTIPQIAVMCGNVAGGQSYQPGLSDLIFMTKKSATFIAGPPIVETVTGEKTTPEELGGAIMHSSVSGVCHVLAENDIDVINKVKQLLSFLPSNYSEKPPIIKNGDDPYRTCESLYSIIPDDPKIPYSMHEIIYEIIDNREFFEIHKDYAKSMIVGFSRFDGQPVGIIGNNPNHLAGGIDVLASEKASRFIRFCDCFNVPILFLVSAPGYIPGTAQERLGMIYRGSKLLYAVSEATVPKITVITGWAYAGAYMAMGSKYLATDFVYAWPTAEIGLIAAEGVVNTIYRKEISASKDPESERKKREKEFRDKYMNIDYPASYQHVDDVIDPKDTRIMIIRGLEVLKNKEQSLPSKKHGNMPL